MQENFKKIKRVISLVTLITFIVTNSVYGAPSSRSFFKGKKVDYEKLNTQREEQLQKKKSVFQGEDVTKKEELNRETRRVLSSHLQDLSQIHIPAEIGRVIEVYDASSVENRPQITENRLIVHIQDLHTNPEGQYNLANILEILLKDYNLGLVCSEGADGEVDTSSVSSFPDAEVREKTAKIFVNSGELTGEEYLSITKYPALPIWGIEDRDIYFENIIQFNKIMKFNPQSQVFISQAKKALEELKPKIYTKELLSLDQKEIDYENQKIETEPYLRDLTSYIHSFNIPTDKYRNISILNEAIGKEQAINQEKIMQESQNLLLNLQSALASSNSRKEIDSLMVKAQLFKEQKVSPFSFYSYLKDIALKYLPDRINNYPNLNDFIDYLTKVNSLDTTKLFVEMEDLTYEIKQKLAKTDEQKTLIKALRNIKFLEGFFNLKVSNEELDYYLENKESHKVDWFKFAITNLTNKTNSTNQTSYIDYNPDLIDMHLEEIEDFYKTVRERDMAMIKNATSEIEKRNVKVAALVSGGFHTKGLTRMLREKGYSYIVVSPYSKTDIDEENYHFLLSGKRKPIEELIKQLDLPEIIDRFSTSLRLGLAFDPDFIDPEAIKEIARIWGISEEEVTPQNILGRIASLMVLKSGRLAERWTLGIFRIDIIQPLDKPNTIQLKVYPQRGNSYTFELTKDDVKRIKASEVEGKTIVSVGRKGGATKVAGAMISRNADTSTDKREQEGRLSGGRSVAQVGSEKLVTNLNKLSRVDGGIVAGVGLPDVHGRIFTPDGRFFTAEGKFNEELQQFMNSLSDKSVQEMIDAGIMYYDIRSKFWRSGSSDFSKGELDIERLKNTLRTENKANIILLEVLNIDTSALQDLTEDQILSAFNAVLKMPDFYAKVDAAGLVGKFNPDEYGLVFTESMVTPGRGSVWGLMHTMAKKGVKVGDKITVLGILRGRVKHEREKGKKTWSEASVRNEFKDAAEKLEWLRRTDEKDKNGRDLYEVRKAFTPKDLKELAKLQGGNVQKMLNRGRIRGDEVEAIKKAMKNVRVNKILASLAEKGHALSKDFITPEMIESGQLQGQVERKIALSATTNPSSNAGVWDLMVNKTKKWVPLIEAMIKKDMTDQEIYDTLFIEHLVVPAMKIFAPINKETNYMHGYVSYEFRPKFTADPDLTQENNPQEFEKQVGAALDELIRLDKLITEKSDGLHNFFIKVPATHVGIEAGRRAIASYNININWTLIATEEQYIACARAYKEAERIAIEKGLLKKGPYGVSVASDFVSRTDREIDPLLSDLTKLIVHIENRLRMYVYKTEEEKYTLESLASEYRDLLKPENEVKRNAKLKKMKELKMQSGLAYAIGKVYRIFKQEFIEGRGWEEFAEENNILIQQIYWGSTGVKEGGKYTANPHYAGPLRLRGTTNTAPPDVVDAMEIEVPFDDKLADPLLGERNRVLNSLAALGIDIGFIQEKVYREGLVAFAKDDKKTFNGIGEFIDKIRGEGDQASINVQVYGPVDFVQGVQGYYSQKVNLGSKTTMVEAAEKVADLAAVYDVERGGAWALEDVDEKAGIPELIAAVFGKTVQKEDMPVIKDFFKRHFGVNISTSDARFLVILLGTGIGGQRNVTGMLTELVRLFPNRETLLYSAFGAPFRETAQYVLGKLNEAHKNVKTSKERLGLLKRREEVVKLLLRGASKSGTTPETMEGFQEQIIESLILYSKFVYGDYAGETFSNTMIAKLYDGENFLTGGASVDKLTKDERMMLAIVLDRVILATGKYEKVQQIVDGRARTGGSMFDCFAQAMAQKLQPEFQELGILKVSKVTLYNRLGGRTQIFGPDAWINIYMSLWNGENDPITRLIDLARPIARRYNNRGDRGLFGKQLAAFAKHINAEFMYIGLPTTIERRVIDSLQQLIGESIDVGALVGYPTGIKPIVKQTTVLKDTSLFKQDDGKRLYLLVTDKLASKETKASEEEIIKRETEKGNHVVRVEIEDHSPGEVVRLFYELMGFVEWYGNFMAADVLANLKDHKGIIDFMMKYAAEKKSHLTPEQIENVDFDDEEAGQIIGTLYSESKLDSTRPDYTYYMALRKVLKDLNVWFQPGVEWGKTAAQKLAEKLFVTGYKTVIDPVTAEQEEVTLENGKVAGEVSEAVMKKIQVKIPIRDEGMRKEFYQEQQEVLGHNDGAYIVDGKVHQTVGGTYRTEEINTTKVPGITVTGRYTLKGVMQKIEEISKLKQKQKELLDTLDGAGNYQLEARRKEHDRIDGEIKKLMLDLIDIASQVKCNEKTAQQLAKVTYDAHQRGEGTATSLYSGRQGFEDLGLEDFARLKDCLDMFQYASDKNHTDADGDVAGTKTSLQILTYVGQPHGRRVVADGMVAPYWNDLSPQDFLYIYHQAYADVYTRQKVDYIDLRLEGSSLEDVAKIYVLFSQANRIYVELNQEQKVLLDTAKRSQERLNKATANKLAGGVLHPGYIKAIEDGMDSVDMWKELEKNGSSGDAKAIANIVRVKLQGRSPEILRAADNAFTMLCATYYKAMNEQGYGIEGITKQKRAIQEAL